MNFQPTQYFPATPLPQPLVETPRNGWGIHTAGQTKDKAVDSSRASGWPALPSQARLRSIILMVQMTHG